jgi:hypothetical protein
MQHTSAPASLAGWHMMLPTYSSFPASEASTSTHVTPVKTRSVLRHGSSGIYLATSWFLLANQASGSGDACQKKTDICCCLIYIYMWRTWLAYIIISNHWHHQNCSNTVRTLERMVYSKHPLICLVLRGIKRICLDAIGFFSMLTAPLLDVANHAFGHYLEARSMKLEPEKHKL